MKNEFNISNMLPHQAFDLLCGRAYFIHSYNVTENPELFKIKKSEEIPAGKLPKCLT
jgi:hypothetical protein